MKVISCIYGSEIIDNYRNDVTIEKLKLVDDILYQVVSSISCVRFYEILSGILECVLQSYTYSSIQILPSKKTFCVSAVLGTVDGKLLSLKEFVDFILKDKNVEVYRSNIIYNIQRLTDQLDRINLCASLFRINNQNICDELDNSDDFPDSEAHHQYLPEGLKKIFNHKDSVSLENVVNRYVYVTLGWGNLLSAVPIFDTEMKMVLTEKYQTPFHPEKG